MVEWGANRHVRLNKIGVVEPHLEIFPVEANLAETTALFRKFKRVEGIYFLLLENQVVYVGKSGVNVAQRLKDHYKKQMESGDKPFDSFAVLEEYQGLGELEADYVLLYTPRYNTSFPVNAKYLPFQDYPPYSTKKRVILEMISKGSIWFAEFRGCAYVLAKDIEILFRGC